jgi:hypothetical protein
MAIGNEIMEFLTFERFLAMPLMKIIYIVGVIVLTIGGLTFLVIGITTPAVSPYIQQVNTLLTFGGLIMASFGNLVWRLACEFVVAIFRINENIAKLQKCS